jgi:predicted nucleotidyltransferase
VYGLPDKAIERINAVFLQYPAVEKTVLYGSRAKGSYRNGSDIDLTLFGEIPFKELLHIENDLDDLLLPWMIDLSIFSHIDNSSLIDHITRIGAVFYERSA